MSDTGTRTEEIHTVRASPKEDTSNPLRRTAQRYTIAGFALLATTLALALTAWILTSGNIWDDPKGHFFAALGIITLGLAGSGLVAAGASRRSAAEVLDRITLIHMAVAGERRQVRQLADEIRQLADAQHWKLAPIVEALPANLGSNALVLERVVAQVHDLDTSMRANFSAIYPVVAVAAELPERLDRIERMQSAVTGYFQKALHTAHWEGYAKAVREGFVETGTEGQGARPARLGLVPRQDREDPR